MNPAPRRPPLPRPVVLDTNPSSPVMHSGWPGIGRVITIENYLLVNNLYRNFEIASTPRGYQTSDAPRPGVFVSRRIGKFPRRLEYRQELAEWGMVSALAASTDPNFLAIASGERIGLFVFECDAGGVRFVRCLWEAAVPYYTQWIGFDRERTRVLVAGYVPSAQNQDSYSWNACCGGGLVAFSLRGERLLGSSLPEGTAWGYGASPVALSGDGHVLYAVDRAAGLYRLSTLTGAVTQVYEGVERIDETPSPSLGIGHCDVMRRCLYAGFSRGDYRLFRYELS